MQAERGSLGWLCLNYYQSADFRRLDARTQHVRHLILDGLCQKGGGPLPYSKLTPLSILKWRNAKADRPETANSLIKALRQLYAFAIEYRHATKTSYVRVASLCKRSDRWRMGAVGAADATALAWRPPARRAFVDAQGRRRFCLDRECRYRETGA